MGDGRRAPRLLLVLNNAAFFISHRLPLGLAAMAAGYEVHIACPESDTLRELAALGFTVHPVPIERYRHTAVTEYRTLTALVDLYRRVRPDLVHHVTVKAVLYGSLAARLTGVPAVVNAMSGFGYLYIARGPIAWARRVAVEATYRVSFRGRGRRVIFQNPDDMRAFVERGLVRRSDAVLVRGSGVDPDVFRPAVRPPPGPPLVVLPARMLWDKGVGEFVGAVRLLRDRGAEFRAALVGGVDPGNPTSVPEDRLRGWVKEGTVEWWGHRTDMPSVFAGSSVVCLPSYREGVPKALLEAASAGLPVVTTDVPGCREATLHGVTGLLVPPRDATALASALGTLLSEPELRVRMGEAGRQLVLREFTVQRIVAEQMALYTEVLGPR